MVKITSDIDKKKIRRKHVFKTQLGYYAMFIVPACCVFLFNYVPMLGIYTAFVDYKPRKGIFGSEFVGFKNFIDFFKSIDFTRVIRNTIFYNVASITLVSLLAGIIFALLLYEVKSRVANKIFHTCMLIPAFLSWTVVSAALLIFLDPDRGLLNGVFEWLGKEPIRWYRSPEYWPAIIIIAQIYKNAGMSSIYFYSALLSIDTELFDAASIDGASRIKQIIHISLPAISKVFCITLISAVGGILAGGVSPFYELTLDSGQLYETTLTLGVYMKNGLGGGRYAFTTAVGLVQSLVGLVLVLCSNAAVKRIDPDSAMF